MASDFDGKLDSGEEQTICFSEAMDWQSLPTNSDNITVCPVTGDHRTGSSQIRVVNIVDSAWEKCFHWGNLVATHHSGNYFAYALTVPGKPAGMVRVIRRRCSDRILLKGFYGCVRDLCFAFHDKRILVAAVDEFGYLLVHEIIEAEVHLILQVNPDSISKSSESHRVVWCPYVPDSSKSNDNTEEDVRNDAEDHALLLATSHDDLVEIWHLGHVNGVVTYKTITTGATQITVFEEAVVDIAFSPDSTAVAVASLDGYVRFFLVNTEKNTPQILHKWQPHAGKQLSGVTFLDNLSHPNIRDSPLWKWAVTSADHNTELKLWSCEQWECHQTIRFQSPDNAPITQKMTIDLSASFLLISDIYRKIMYVLRIEQIEDGNVSKVTSITQLLLPFSAISLAIRQASFKLSSDPMGAIDEDFTSEQEDKSRVMMKLLVVQPKSLQKCKVVFELGTSVPLGEGGGSSYSQTSTSINTTVSEFEGPSSKGANQQFSLLTPDAFISPAKTVVDSMSIKQALPASPVATGSMPLPSPTPNEMLALSSPRRPTPEVTSSTTPRRNGLQSGGSSPSREVEEILGTCPSIEGTVASPDTSSMPVPSGPALQDAITAYPPSLSPAFTRIVSGNSKENSPSLEKFKAPDHEDVLSSYASVSAIDATTTTAPVASPIPTNGSLMDLFSEALGKPIENLPQPTSALTQTWPTVLPSHVQNRPKEQPSKPLENETSLTAIQQTLNQLVKMVAAQQADQVQMKDEIMQLRTDLGRIKDAQATKPAWVPQLESAITLNFDRQLKKLEDTNSFARTQQIVSKLQATMRSELDNKAHTLEQKSVDFLRKELQSVIATEMIKLEPIIRSTTLQLLTHLSQNKAILDSYSQAASSAAVTAMNRSCKETVTQQLLPSLERSFQTLFNQLHDTFAKGITEFVQNIEGNLERHRRLQDKEASTHLNSTMEKMRAALEQARGSISTDTKNELRKLSQDFPEKVRLLLTPVIQAEMLNVVKNQKTALDGALLAVQQAAQTRSPTPSVGPSTPLAMQTQLKHMINEGLFCEAFQRALSVSDLNMVLFVCGRVDAQRLFSSTPCVLPQPVLLSLIQQLSADLGTATELKLNYLQEAVLAIDMRDPVTKGHVPSVMSLLVQQLQTQVSQHTGGTLSRQLRLLLLAAQPLQHKN